jgi:hypothetical protein
MAASPAVMTSARRASLARRSCGAVAEVMTMVRASGAASVNSGLSGSSSSRALTTAIGGVAGRPSRKCGQRRLRRAGP